MRTRSMFALTSAAAALGVAAMIGFAAPSAWAAPDGPALTVDPPGAALSIDGLYDGQTTTYGGYVRLTLTGAPTASLRLLSTDLRHAGEAGVAIDRADVTIPAGTVLAGGQPADVRVTINNVKRFGDYAGELTFVAALPSAGDAFTPALTATAPIRLRLVVQPSVKMVATGLNLQVVNCGDWLDCLLSTWFLPASVVRDAWPVWLENRAPVSATVAQAAVLMRGDKTGASLDASQVFITTPQTVPAQFVSPVALNVVRRKLPADRYAGTVQLQVQGMNEPVTLSVTIDARNGPLLAILAVMLGIVIGRLLRDRQTPQAQKQEKLFPRYRQLLAQAESIRDAAARDHVKADLETAQHKIAYDREDEAAVTAYLDQRDREIQLLVWFDDAESWLRDKTAGDPQSAANLELTRQVMTRINDARALVTAHDLEKAEALKGEIAALQIAQGEQPTAPRSGAGARGLEDGEPEGLTKAAPVAPRTAWGAVSRGATRVVAVLVGANPDVVETRFWLVRGVLWLVLLVLLVLVGLQAIYVNNGATFGANGIYDYLALFLWGMSAEVAQRTLQSFQAKQAG
jgi:hypothetical protein